MFEELDEAQVWQLLLDVGRGRPEVIQANTDTRQLVVGWRVHRAGQPSPLMVQVYTTLYGVAPHAHTQGRSMVMVALVDTENGLTVHSAWAQRTHFWPRRLRVKVRQMLDFAEQELGEEPPKVPFCPGCSHPMMLRIAKHGKNPGSRFWGCARYPECKQTVPYTEAGSVQLGNKGEDLQLILFERLQKAPWSN